jgi:hypothetical protein
VIVLLRWLHAGVITNGVLVLLALGPWPTGRRHGRIDEQDAAAQAGTLVRRADVRALAQLAGASQPRPVADHLVARTAAHQPSLDIAPVGPLADAAICAVVGPE